MKTVLVTGAGGYIGSILVPKLLANDYRVKAVDRYFFGQDKLQPADKLQIIRDDSRKLQDDLFEDVYALIDLVALSNDPAGETFSQQTWEINHQSRVASARRSKIQGVKRYILPSSCSIYGFTENVVDETAPTNPLTTYARANRQAELESLALADEDFTVVVLRQATVFGYSPRMRFDLAINGMTYGAWKNRILPLMRDGTQYRPMVHIQDTTDVMMQLLECDPALINKQIFNIGSEACNFQIRPLAEMVARVVSEKIGHKVDIEWYGDPDNRSYRVSFDKIERTLKWKARRSGEDGVLEIIEALDAGRLDKTPQTITLEWYRQLVTWHKIIKSVEQYGGILEIY